jgi:hypothetical protein
MYDLTAGALILSIPHLLILYLSIFVWNLTYPQVVLVNAAIVLASVVLVRYLFPNFNAKIKQFINQDRRQDTLVEDMIGMLTVFAGTTVVSARMMTWKFGVTGWLVMAGVNGLINAVV